jgi:hypothetical protein
MRSTLKLVVAVLSLVLLLVLLERVYYFGLIHNQNIKLTRVQRPINADILFLGPCEPHWGVSPGLLHKLVDAKIYNLALNNSDFADNYLHLHLYLKTNKAPAFVFLYVTPASFDLNTNTFNSFRFAPYLNDPLVDSVVTECDPDYRRWAVLPFMKYAYYNGEVTFNVLQGYKHFFAGRSHAYYEDGYEPPAEQSQNVRNGQLIFRNHSVKYIWSTEREKYLRKIIRLGKSVGAQVILYESPVYKQYLKSEGNRGELKQRVRDVAEQEKISFVQFKDLPFTGDASMFNAPRNLNRKGVVLFADTFGRYLHVMIHR